MLTNKETTECQPTTERWDCEIIRERLDIIVMQRSFNNAHAHYDGFSSLTLRPFDNAQSCALGQMNLALPFLSDTHTRPQGAIQGFYCSLG